MCGTNCDNNYLAEIKQARLKVIHNDVDKNIITVEMNNMEDLYSLREAAGTELIFDIFNDEARIEVYDDWRE
ncbi:hypothetical protein [Jeotgalibaca porci]|uniref:hypothetical protein n=1 Tax=Jeotgalibaca porci TaxID=1868793 RepID=UPI0035A0FE6B